QASAPAAMPQASAPAAMPQASAPAASTQPVPDTQNFTQPDIPAAQAVPVLETPVETPITAPVAPAPQFTAVQAEAADFENSFSNLPVFEMPVTEAPQMESAPIEKIPFASNVEALLNGTSDKTVEKPPMQEQDSGQNLFSDNDFFADENPFENGFSEIPSQPTYSSENDATRAFEPLTAQTNDAPAFDDFMPKETASAPAFNPFESSEWKDEADIYADDDEDIEPRVSARRQGRTSSGNGGGGVARPRSSAPRNKKPKKANQLPLILLLAVLVIAIIGIAIYAISGGLGKKKAPSSSVALPSSSVAASMAPSSTPLPPAPAVAPIPRDEWYMKLANKQSPLSADFKVETEKTVDGIEVDARIRGAVNDMIAGAKEQGVKLKTVAGYRSYQRQENSYNNRVAEFVKAGKTKEEAQAAAAIITAPPGASEHNLGLSVDMQSVASHDYADTFKDSAEAKWLLDNAANYGFILRYPAGKEAVTGFDFEPWHYRYVGVEQAQKIKESGLTLEEYLAQDAPTGVPEAAAAPAAVPEAPVAASEAPAAG
ncbi:MAG: D-alanyl-D-alanine carboxypeptidase family protein, partial [Ruthenibacterium sp.]